MALDRGLLDVVVCVVLLDPSQANYAWTLLRSTFGPDLSFNLVRTERNELPPRGNTYHLRARILSENFTRVADAIQSGAWFRQVHSLLFVLPTFLALISSFLGAQYSQSIVAHIDDRF